MVDDDVRRLEGEVNALRRTVAALVELLFDADVFRHDRRTVERRLAAAGRLEREELDEDQEAKVEAARDPYRGGAAGGIRCAVCAKILGEDDPELSLERRGRVCIGCYHRGRQVR